MSASLQKQRLAFTPTRPAVLETREGEVHGIEPITDSPAVRQDLASWFPYLSAIRPHVITRSSTNSRPSTPLKIGLVVAGGPAPGANNVIWGLHDYLKSIDPNNILYGFLGGPSGLISCDFREITSQRLAAHRNQGGFELLLTGRHAIESEEDIQSCLDACRSLELSGLVVMGDSSSMTNAAFLAEKFAPHHICVVGCPKTIDGDLIGPQYSLGFDTATKTYSELIGNIMADANSNGKYYHFIRLMGRSSSHVTLECALATRPNIAIIGEEMANRKRSLQSLVQEIADIVVRRAKKGLHYGVVLVPDDLLEFIPEFAYMLEELNKLRNQRSLPADIASLCTERTRQTLEQLPKRIREQLVGDRDPHGHLQVTRIPTERLLINLVSKELALRKKQFRYHGTFQAFSHYFGYEGRCGLPSNFDCHYGAAMGRTAGILLQKQTGVMATCSHLHLPASQWQPMGVPFLQSMSVERDNGVERPYIKRSVVDLTHVPFKTFQQLRSEWALTNAFICPGPMQFYGPTADRTTITLQLVHGQSYEQIQQMNEQDIELPSKF